MQGHAGNSVHHGVMPDNAGQCEVMQHHVLYARAAVG